MGVCHEDKGISCFTVTVPVCIVCASYMHIGSGLWVNPLNCHGPGCPQDDLEPWWQSQVNGVGVCHEDKAL